MSLGVHIDTLVLHGFAPGARGRIAAGLARELERLVTAHGLPPGLLADSGVSTMDAGSFVVPRGARPELIGVYIARSVYGPSPTGRHTPLPDTIGG